MIGGPGAKNAFIIKAPMTSTIPTATVQTRPIIKGNVIPNRNITVRKVMNVMPSGGAKQMIGKPITSMAATSSSAMNILTIPSTVQSTPQPMPTQSPIKQLMHHSSVKPLQQSPVGKQSIQSPAKSLQQLSAGKPATQSPAKTPSK